ncbi:hypothetical protein Trydic_g5389 [Trypoxylus dichotomus]
MLHEALKDASDSSSSKIEYSDDNSTIGNTSDDAGAESEGFRPPSKRQQRKRKGSRNSGSETGDRKHPEAKLVPTGGTGPQPVPATAPNLKTKEGRVELASCRAKE